MQGLFVLLVGTSWFSVRHPGLMLHINENNVTMALKYGKVTCVFEPDCVGPYSVKCSQFKLDYPRKHDLRMLALNHMLGSQGELSLELERMDPDMICIRWSFFPGGYEGREWFIKC